MCVYNKKNICIYVCVWGCLDKYISVATWPSQTKIPGSVPTCILVNCKVRNYDDLFSSKNYVNLFGMVHSILYNEDEVSIYAMISSRVMDSLFVKVKSYF